MMAFFSVESHGLPLWAIPIQCQQAKGYPTNIVRGAKITVKTVHELLALLEVVLEDFCVVLAASANGQNVCVFSRGLLVFWGTNCDCDDPDIVVLLFDEAVQKAITPEINVSYFDLLFMKTSFGLFCPLVADHLTHQCPEGSCAIQTLSVLLLIGFCCIVPKVEVSSMTRRNEDDLFDADACMITDLKHLWNRKVLEDAV